MGLFYCTLAIGQIAVAGTDLATQQYPVYELLAPGGSAHFKLKTSAPGAVATVAMGIAEATPVE